MTATIFAVAEFFVRISQTLPSETSFETSGVLLWQHPWALNANAPPTGMDICI